MSRLRQTSRRAAGATALCLAAGLCSALWPGPGGAQESELRGPVIASELNAVLQPRTQTSVRNEAEPRERDEAASDYRPVSAGALDDEEASGRTVSTAARRERERRQQVEADEPPDGDAEEASLTTGAVNERARRGERARPTNERADAIAPRERRPETDAFAPLGLRLGAFTVVPVLEQGLTWSSNAEDTPDGESAVLSETNLRLTATSDWSRHAATLEAYGSYRESISGADVSELEGGADAELELDLGSDLRGLARLAYEAGPESATSPVVIADVADRPLRQSMRASLGLEKDVGRLRLGLTGEAERDRYGNARLTDGTALSQRDRNATLVAARLRGGYRLSPALMPFVEAEAGRRIYDERVDSAGFERSATRFGARAGLVFDMGEKFSGEVAAGWLTEDIDDSRLAAISSPSLAASLNWSPMRGTNVGFSGRTTVEGTTDAGDSGSILYSGTVTVDRQLRANLTGQALLGAYWRDYTESGHDLSLVGEAELTWWLNRFTGINGRLRHERFTSSFAGRDYDATSVFVGMRLQR